ncbi:MAG: homoserine kinase [Gammaproteobacteria bacterium]|nr:homoserine kinase [Gammaproteobacteria bacterium]MCI0590503.1 homoserine kinase [Gammaproteobacteria bacterium]
MSVYTPVSRQELQKFLGHYSLGELRHFEGISEGIENTNYFVATTKGEFVLTLFEWLEPAQLPYFLELMAFLSEKHMPSAHPIADKSGNYLRQLNGKASALVQRLTGTSVTAPTERQCFAIGEFIGRMHTAGAQFRLHRENDRGPRWWKNTAAKVQSTLSAEDASLLRRELEYQSQFRHHRLSRGVIHADLFRDNALFVGDRLTGVIDFYYACNDVLIYDLAVTVNDWCNSDNGDIYPDRARAILRAYAQRYRPIEPDELDAWPVMLRAAALRFWLSRLHDMHFPRQGEITHIKDPDVFKRILRHRVEHTDALRHLWN